MNYSNIEIAQFIELAQEAGSCVFDARSEGEYASGHIPGAHSLPLLRNEERHEVGLCYKQEGSEAAVELGFKLVGPRFAQIIAEAKQKAKGRRVLVYCWRGGLRSNIMAWLLQTAGLRVSLLVGGYKSWRTMCLQLFEQGPKFKVIGGPTGVGKTELLECAVAEGIGCLNLEFLAQHKGSAFGGMERPQEVTQEHFENLLAHELWKYRLSECIWLEDESRFIGRIRIPDGVFERLSNAEVCFVERPKELRVHRILAEYGGFDKALLAERTLSLRKRMGGDQVAKSLESLEQGDMQGWLEPLLAYYDKGYHYGFAQHTDRRVRKIFWNEESCLEIVKIIAEE